MRNSTIVLSDAQKRNAYLARVGLSARQYGDKVTLDYTKRDGEAVTLTGNIVNFVGEADKEAVVLLTAEGYRSANLWSIKDMR